MLALIMAGGRGTRLQMGEKGLVRLCGRPLIDYVLSAITQSGLEPVVITTPFTPYTSNYCRALGLDQICTKGAGYIEDINEAITALEEPGPILIICADIPGITNNHINYIIDAYQSGGKDSCSVWTPAEIFKKFDCTARYIQEISGVPAAAAGINIQLGEKILQNQSEQQILICDPALVFNINTRQELKTAEIFFSTD